MNVTLRMTTQRLILALRTALLAKADHVADRARTNPDKRGGRRDPG